MLLKQRVRPCDRRDLQGGTLHRTLVGQTAFQHGHSQLNLIPERLALWAVSSSSCLIGHILYACILQVGGQEHFYLETNAACVIPQENDEFLLISSTQVGKCWSGGEVFLWLERIGTGLQCMP